MKDGLIIIDKPAGITSHDVVAKLRKILKTKKIGHTGTLDPFATGVLVMLVGKATRLARFLHSDEKEYEAVMRFGYETETGDVTGERRQAQTEVRGTSTDRLKRLGGLSAADISKVLPEFTGQIEQIPPMYSAKKIKGKKLYEMAREGTEVEREPVNVTITEIECTGELGRKEETADFGLRVVCSAGTYVRTLAEDIGRKIGVGCHLAELRRLRAGRFGIAEAGTLDELAALSESGKEIGLLPMNLAVAHLPKIVLTASEEDSVRHGRKLELTEPPAEDDAEIALLTARGELAAIGEWSLEKGAVSPRLVMI